MNNCVFCQKIREEKLPEYDHEDSRIYCFEPLNPVTPGHVLFIAHLHSADASANPGLAAVVFKYAAQYAQQQMRPFNLITSGGRDATQSVSHFHVHYVPRAKDDGLTLPWTGQKND